MDFIKERSLIVSDIFSADKNQRTIVIKKRQDGINRDTFLGDVFSVLPQGIIYKEETGMGATTLELLAPRNSIIVEPIKITASSKAHKHQALYVGGPTRYHKKGAVEKDIKEYLQNNSIEHKKIVVVADSLYKVISVIKKSKHGEFFLLIDEVDSFQLDSSFRKSMEQCVDIYKSFNKEKRAMLSATLIDFSDPVLSQEPLTILKYDSPTVRNIELVVCSPLKFWGSVVNEIIRKKHEYPDEKIMVAYNSVNGCMNIINELLNHSIYQAKDISLLCGINSKEKAGTFYTELEKPELPSKINFCTSAYFTGFDLEEQYHLISVTSILNKIHALSDKRLKQVAGRARNGLLSETIIQNFEQKVIDIISKEECIEEAEREISILRCIKRQLEQSKILSDNYDRISTVLLNTLEYEGKRFIRNSNTIDPKISYLNIDAYIEMNYVVKIIYQETDTLYQILKDAGHNIAKRIGYHNRKVENLQVDNQYRTKKIDQILELIQRYPNEPDKIFLEIFQDDLDPIQRKIFRHYKNLYQHIEVQNLIEGIKKHAYYKDSRPLNSYIFSATFMIYPEGELFKSRVTKYIKVGESYTKAELTRLWNLIFVETGLRRNNFSDTKAVKLTNSIFNTRKKRSGVFLILSLNKHSIDVQHPILEVEQSITDEDIFKEHIHS
ncbi:MAG: hypothetical protein JSR12_11500 [Bacteroidetes bacterium]|nr:hypothetical protein [Bacteroidota bacterium]